MKDRAYKDFKEISDLLLVMEKSILNSTRETYNQSKELCKSYIKHINDDIIELMKLYLDNTTDEYALKIIDKTKRNLIAINFMVFDRIDPTKLDNDTYLRFQQKLINWIDYYKEKIDSLMMDYYVICFQEDFKEKSKKKSKKKSKINSQKNSK
jgi:hypothetical protein